MIKIDTKAAPAAIGPYSQAIVSGGILYTSGQIPIDPNTGDVSTGTMSQQAQRAAENIAAIAKAAGTSLDKTIKTTCFISDMNEFAEFNDVYSKYFVGSPARSCVEVSALPKGVKCEIEAIIRIGED